MNSAILFHEKRPQNRLFSTSKCRKSSNGNNRSKRNSTRVVSSTISSATSDVINDIGMDDPTENYRLHLHNQRKGKSQNGFYSKQMLNFQPVSTLSTSFRKTYNNNGIIRRKPPSSSLRELNISDDELSPLTIGSKKCSKFIPAKSKPQSDKKNQPLNHSLFNLVIHNSASSSTSRNNIYNTSHKYDETNCLSSSSSPTDFPLVEKQLSPLQKINSSHKLRGMDIVNKCDVGYTINKQNGKNMNQPLYSLQNDTSVPNNSVNEIFPNFTTRTVPTSKINKNTSMNNKNINKIRRFSVYQDPLVHCSQDMKRRIRDINKHVQETIESEKKIGRRPSKKR